jgi:hypothetical protein
VLDPLETEYPISTRYKFISYFIGNTLRLHYKDQMYADFQRNTCYYPYETHTKHTTVLGVRMRSIWVLQQMTQILTSPILRDNLTSFAIALWMVMGTS